MIFFIYSALINAFISGLLGFLVIFKNRKEIINKVFFGLNISIVFWSLSYWQWMLSDNSINALLWIRLLSIGSLFIPIFYFHWILSFCGLNKSKKNFLKILYFIGFIFLLFSFSNNFIESVESKYIFPFWPNAGILYSLYLIFIYFGLTIYALIILRKEYKRKSLENKLSIKYIFWGSIIGFSGGATNFFLWYDIPIFPYGNILVSLYPIVLSVAIFKYQLFNIKVLATELLTFAIWLFLFIRLLVSNSFEDKVIDGILFVSVVIFGVSLIRSVLKEVKAREELEKITKSLEETNIKLSIKTKYLTALQDFSASIIETLDLKKIVQLIVDGVSERFGYLGALLLLISEDGKKIYPVAVSQSSSVKIALKLLPKKLEEYQYALKNDPALSSLSVNTGKFQIDEDFSKFFSAVPKNILKNIQRVVGIKTTIAIPVKAKGKFLGVLDIVTKKSKENFTQEEFDVLRTLANQIGIILENTELFNKVIRSAKDLRRLNQRLKRLDAAKSEFISIASHQLRTPLSAIKGYVSMMMDGDFGLVNHKLEEPLKRVYLSNQRLIDLVENLLNISRMESGRMQYSFELVDLAGFVNGLIKDLQILADRKGIYLKYNKPAKPIAKFFADQEKLRQIVMNLIDNAIKYTKVGGITVTVREEENTKTRKKKIIFMVKDTGIGIDKEDLPLLFQKFERGKGISLVHTEGTGLGLYVCKQLTEAHQGKIKFESKGKNKGSRFIVEFPVLAKPPKVESKPVSPLGQPVAQIAPMANLTNSKKLPEMQEKR